MFRSFVLLLGLMSVTELSANPDLSALESGMDAPTPAPQGGGRFALTGKVLDETGAGIPGASIVVKGSTRGVTTDVDGSFEFEVAAADVLQISYLGYETQEITVGAQTNITVQLKPQVSELETVTVVAYGKQRKESIIGAINTIDTDELRVQSGQLSSNLAGKLAGVVVMQRSGEPGKSADFWIRGVNTFGENNKPLILVDGIEREMDLVDVDDIASLSILKDATATALYGVRGANGIVLITTKRGSEGAAKVSVKAEFGLTQPVKVPEMANAEQWIDYYNEISTYEEGSIKPIDDYQKQMYLSGADPDLYPNVDWMDAIYKNLAMTGRVNVSASGGNKNVRYYVGGSYYTEGGMFNMADNNNYNAQMNFNRFSFRSNIDINITKSTELGLSLSTQYTSKNKPGGVNSDVNNDFYAYAMRTTPISNPTIYSDGTLAVPPEGGGAVNVYNMLNYQGYTKDNRTMAQSLISLTQDFSDIITEGLKVNAKFSWDIDSNNSITRKYNPNQYHATGRDDQGNLMFDQIVTGTGYMSLDYVYPKGWTTINFEASATYDRVFADDHRVGALFLFNMRSKSMLRPTSYLEAWPYRNIGIAGRVTYAFRDKYFAEFNFGYNGSENFAPGKRFGFFPSYAIGYMISNESFWEPLRDKINILKIRASYGTIGNDQIGGGRRFAYNTTLETGAYGFNFGTNAPASHTPPLNGITTKDYGNPDVTWEEATKADVGIELGLYDMLRIQADYFYEKREGIFIQRESQPSVVGTRVQQYVNLGRMRNQGFDMSLEFDKNINKDLWISARGNFTYNRTKKLYDDKPDQIWKYQNKAGFANNQQFGLIAEGLFESEEDIANSPKQDFGTVRVGDINGDGVVNTFDQVAIGYTTVPEINYGFGVSLGWKGLDVSVFFSGVGHVTRIIGGYNLYGGASNYIRQGQIFADVAKNRWSLANPDPNAKYPRMSTTRMENNLQKSTYWQRDMSFLRLKNAEIGYTLPKAWTKKAGLSTVRFYLQGVNLLTFSDFDLWDPELEADYGNQYPTVRTVTLGVNLNF